MEDFFNNWIEVLDSLIMKKRVIYDYKFSRPHLAESIPSN